MGARQEPVTGQGSWGSRTVPRSRWWMRKPCTSHTMAWAASSVQVPSETSRRCAARAHARPPGGLSPERLARRPCDRRAIVGGLRTGMFPVLASESRPAPGRTAGRARCPDLPNRRWRETAGSLLAGDRVARATTPRAPPAGRSSAGCRPSPREGSRGGPRPRTCTRSPPPVLACLGAAAERRLSLPRADPGDHPSWPPAAPGVTTNLLARWQAVRAR